MKSLVCVSAKLDQFSFKATRNKLSAVEGEREMNLFFYLLCYFFESENFLQETILFCISCFSKKFYGKILVILQTQKFRKEIKQSIKSTWQSILFQVDEVEIMGITNPEIVHKTQPLIHKTDARVELEFDVELEKTEMESIISNLQQQINSSKQMVKR